MHDATVLRAAEREADLIQLPIGTYMLADAGYALQAQRVLTPERKTRYHLAEFAAVRRLESLRHPCRSLIRSWSL